MTEIVNIPSPTNSHPYCILNLQILSDYNDQLSASYFLAILSCSQELIESLSKLAINQIASSLVVEYDSDWFKSLWARFFLRVDPLPSGCEVNGKWSEKGPSNRLKIGQQIVYGQVSIATRGFCERQNSYGFRAI